MSLKLSLICCSFAIILLSCNVEGAKRNKEPKVDRFAVASGKFATDLYSEVIKGKPGNVIYSPMSIESVLSLGMLGASGQTKSQMKQTLNYHPDENDREIEVKYQNLTDKVRSTSGLKVANKIYISKRGQLRPNFNQIAKSFDSEVDKLDFEQAISSANTINKWVEDHTNNKIKNLIDSSLLNNETRILIVNAIYFKANWDLKFDPAKTTKTAFFTDKTRSSEIDMMHMNSRYRYGSFPDHHFTSLELNYRDTDISLLLLLPDERDGLGALEDKLKQIDLHAVQNDMYTYDTVLALPKFKIDFDINLNEPLKKLGMTKMFTDNAEFGKLLQSNEGLKVSDVVHKAFIEVNEEGAEAAGSTGFYGAVQLSLPVIKNFKCDHPFLFVLKNKSQIFFMGRFTGQ